LMNSISWFQSHMPHWMSWSCHITGCKNSIRHTENRFSPYFFVFNAVWVLTSDGFRIVSDTLVVIIRFRFMGHWANTAQTDQVTLRPPPWPTDRKN